MAVQDLYLNNFDQKSVNDIRLLSSSKLHIKCCWNWLRSSYQLNCLAEGFPLDIEQMEWSFSPCKAFGDCSDNTEIVKSGKHIVFSIIEKCHCFVIWFLIYSKIRLMCSLWAILMLTKWKQWYHSISFSEMGYLKCDYIKRHIRITSDC
jgi:hypothetical protein